MRICSLAISSVVPRCGKLPVLVFDESFECNDMRGVNNAGTSRDHDIDEIYVRADNPFRATY